METKETKNKKGRLIVTNKETGEERVFAYADFERLLDVFYLLDTPLTKLFGAQCSCTYRGASDSPAAATAETYKWTARIVCEDLYREEEALPPTAEEEEARRVKEAYEKAKEVCKKAEEEARRIDPTQFLTSDSDRKEE